MTTSSGDVLEGNIVLVQEPMQIGFAIDNLNDAVLFLEMEPAGEGEVRPGLWLSTYGLTPARLATLREHFGALYRSALSMASPIA